MMAIRVMTLTDMKKTRMRSRLLRLLPHLPKEAWVKVVTYNAAQSRCEPMGKRAAKFNAEGGISGDSSASSGARGPGSRLLQALSASSTNVVPSHAVASIGIVGAPAAGGGPRAILRVAVRVPALRQVLRAWFLTVPLVVLLQWQLAAAVRSRWGVGSTSPRPLAHRGRGGTGHCHRQQCWA